MVRQKIVHIMREYRTFAPKSIRSALRLLADEFGEACAASAVALVLPREKTVYVSNWPPGLDRFAFKKALRMDRGDSYLWISVGGATRVDDDRSGAVDILKIPVFEGLSRIGLFAVISMTDEGFSREERRSVPALSEFLSAQLAAVLTGGSSGSEEREDESDKIELLSSIGNDRRMRRILGQLMEQAGCEFCAFHAGQDRELDYIMLEGAELAHHIEEIKDKLATAYGMFSNRDAGDRPTEERVFVKNEQRNVAYLVGISNLESYFLVPVMFASRLRGVLFFGSVRREAFGKNQIERFRRMAEEEDECAQIACRPMDETESLERLLEILPFGGAIVSSEGMILHANEMFEQLLRVHGHLPEAVHEVRGRSPFNLEGIWEEFRVLKRDLVDRELYADTVPGAAIAVTWVRLEGIAQDALSLVLVKDVTGSARRAEETAEILATASHELKTPLTALKNSLKILKDAGAAGVTTHERGHIEFSLPASRFINTAMRTVDRLVMIVNGLGNVTEARTISRPFKPERVLLDSFLGDATLFFLDSIKTKGIDFGIDVDEGASLLEFDPGQMEQVIHNLLSNSIKHVSAGGKIAISAEPADEGALTAMPTVPWDLVGRPEFVDLSIRDSGSGIPSDVIENINPSRRPARARNLLSRGLGLYIASRLVRNQGGALVIDRLRGAGSNVHLFLPADSSTGNAVRVVYTLMESLEDMVKRGVNPVIYAVCKESDSCWLEIMGMWRSVPVMNPERGEITDTGLYFWPLGPRVALGISAQRKYTASPLSIVREGKGALRVLQGDSSDRIRIGWAAAAIDGISYSDLVGVALQRTAAEGVEAVLKGETEWTGTGY